MKSIFSFFLDIEKLIYKILMWFILVPKTLVKITLNPAWAPDYVKEELEKDQTPFDEYISPIILLLVVALIPAVAFNLLPTFGASISSPAETQPTTDRVLSFEVRTDFRSSSKEMDYFHTWTVSRVGSASTGSGNQVIKTEIHYPQGPVNFIEEIDDNTVKDKFLFTFQDPGEYLVAVSAGKFDPDKFDAASQQGIVTEIHPSTLRVIVPVKLDDPIVISNEERTKDTEAANPEGLESFTSSVQRENTLFLAIALMLPPLFFALATRLFITAIGEDTLKESFYTQCYYFSPLSLAIWASYYARYFFTSDAYFFASGNLALQIIWLPTLLAALWFVRAEVKTIEDARGLNGIRSLAVTLICIAIMLFAASGIFQFATLQDDVRLLAIRSYPILAATMIAGFGLAWYRRRRSRNEFMKPSHFVGIAVNAVVLIALLGFVSARFGTQTQSNAVPSTEPPQATATELAGATQPSTIPSVPSNPSTSTPEAQDTPTTEPAESPTPTLNPFYVDEFNTDLTKWSTFMTSGDSRMVIPPVVDRGVLPLQLLQVDDRVGQYYLINDAFSYSDVKVEAVATNRGNNSNGVGLICRYSNVGWYEAQISNSQRFAIYVVDSVGLVSQGYNEVLTGESSAIRSGPSTNVYTLTCKGKTISLSVNGELVGEFEDTYLGLTDGKIGLSIWSPQTLPVIVDIETLTVSAPE
ncbi:MAG: hypothetical protein CNIPEHKO_02278 [Anaerolineales bacterium]|nr:hypothetical protein [Anaerolineae bacterium]MBL8105494.1 hypothetical protein [Anaerolineales bacterium]MBV6401974.1 hypothetical protein [Anaerolineales bacterium]MCC7189983.1 hypothetical protein [Anaerolineales bacterium]